jgi:hypothetical protein
LIRWEVERIVHFNFKSDFIVDGLAHFGFHDRTGNYYGVEHQKHFFGFVGRDGRLKWTAAAHQVFTSVPNIAVELKFPIYVDRLLDDRLVVSNFGNCRLYRIDVDNMESTLLVDGAASGMKHAGNCVVDDEGYVWLNEIEGCKIWRFAPTGKPVLTLGNGEPGFQSEITDFDHVRFNWIYDMRKGPDGNIYVLDSKNYAVRMIDIRASRVHTLAGTGRPGYEGDCGDPLSATLGGDSNARFDGPISLSLDELGNLYVGDRFNHVVRMIERSTKIIRTIAGDAAYNGEKSNPTSERNLLSLRLPKISSMDYHDGCLFVPTDLTDDAGDLIVLRKR